MEIKYVKGKLFGKVSYHRTFKWKWSWKFLNEKCWFKKFDIIRKWEKANTLEYWAGAWQPIKWAECRSKYWYIMIKRVGKLFNRGSS